jgi:uncharacterized protein
MGNGSPGVSGVTASGPPGRREVTLDALRGLAVLGGLTVNIRAFASIDAARTNPTAWGDLDGLNLWVWAATYVLADGKFVSLFALVFGAGLAARAARSEVAATAVAHYRRMAALAVLGALHAYLLWWGDWLLIMGVAGATVYYYVEATPRQLITAGLLLYAVYPFLSVGLTVSLPWWPPEVTTHLLDTWSPSAATVAVEIESYRGGWLEQERIRAPRAFAYQTSELALRFLWQVSGLMLLGMALCKMGVLKAAGPPRNYATMAALGLGIGVPMSLYEIHRAFSQGWDMIDYRLVVAPLAYWSSLATTLGWIGLVLLARRLGLRLTSLAAVGRLALSNYMLQTAACTLVFYGHGLGLFARVERTGQLLFVFGLWTVHVVASRAWLARFHIGPVEWAWRAAAGMAPARRLP